MFCIVVTHLKVHSTHQLHKNTVHLTRDVLTCREVWDGAAEEDPAGGGEVPVPREAGGHVRGDRPVAHEEAGEAAAEGLRPEVQRSWCGGSSGGGHAHR